MKTLIPIYKNYASARTYSFGSETNDSYSYDNRTHIKQITKTNFHYRKIPKRVKEHKPEWTRRVRRLELYQVDGVTDDLRKLSIKNWLMIANNKDMWRKVLKEVTDELDWDADDVDFNIQLA